MHSRHMPDIVGRLAGADIERGTPMEWDLVAANPWPTELAKKTPESPNFKNDPRVATCMHR